MNRYPKLLGLPVLGLTIVSLAVALATWHDLRVLWVAVPVHSTNALVWSWIVLAKEYAGIRHGVLAGVIAGASGQLMAALFAVLSFKLYLAFPASLLRVIVIGSLIGGAAMGALIGATVLGIMLRESADA